MRNYTIVGNYKVGFPQWRVMKCQYPGEPNFSLSNCIQEDSAGLCAHTMTSDDQLTIITNVQLCHTHTDTGPCVLKAGDEVYVLGRSQKRGFLIVEHTGQQLHLPHHFTELRVRTIKYYQARRETPA